MFILNNEALRDSNAENISAFLSCWSEFYKFAETDNVTGEPISYLDELHLNGDLDAENIRKLLRWKDRRRFTHPHANGDPNHKVIQIIEHTELFNEFRRGVQTAEFCAFVRRVFRTDRAVHRVFLFHIARPIEYPIWDQHVARVYALLSRQRIDTKKWDHYEAYRKWFNDLKAPLGINNDFAAENVSRAKKLDDALMAYGQFLNTYSQRE